MTFDQQADMERLVAKMARMDLPPEVEPITSEEDVKLQIIADARALYDLIVEAREIMKSHNRRSRR